MSFIYPNVFSNEELHYLNNHPEVLLAKDSLDIKPSGVIYFSVPANGGLLVETCCILFLKNKSNMILN